jgi:arsenate reductase
MLTVYVYQKCSTCRDALKWLDDHGLAHQTKPIRETPPTPAELKAALKLLGGDIRKLFNSSGMDYRALELAKQLPQLSDEEAIALLAGNGNLIKRPLVIGKGLALAGFKPAQWSQTLL